MAAWIATEPSGARGGAVFAAHALIPEAQRHASALLAALVAPDLPLTRREVEMVTTVVSSANRCFT